MLRIERMVRVSVSTDEAVFYFEVDNFQVSPLKVF